MILRLLPLRRPVPPPDGFVIVGLLASCHLRNTLFMSLGIPSRMTVETGTKGLSSMPAARMANSCANSSALWKEAYCGCARAPTIIYSSKKASSTNMPVWSRSRWEKGESSMICKVDVSDQLTSSPMLGLQLTCRFAEASERKSLQQYLS